MGFVTTIITLMLAADLWWWYFADRTARRANLGAGYRVVVGVTMGITLLGLVLLIGARIARMDAMIMPEWGVILTFVWHFLLLPIVLIPSLLAAIGSGLARAFKWIWRHLVTPPQDTVPVQPVDAEADSEPRFDRRAFLGRIVVLAPPVAAVAMTGQSIQNLDDCVIRHDLALIPNLPPALEGLRIAHVSDPHVGSFMSDEKYRRIIDLTNSLDADLVLQTGDLINHNLKDLPDGIQMLQKFRAKFGTYSCQGNHDCIDSRDRFETDTIKADVGMLLDSGRTIDVRGHKVSLMGPRWWGRSESVMRWSVDELASKADKNAFQILLAHHPHCFISAADNKIPLTLAGHTHGGQIALSRHIGVGPLMYKYWHGVYRERASVLNVSAGTGNWFPLRLGVPCEIVHLTLRSA